MTGLEAELEAVGGASAPPTAIARLRDKLAGSLRDGRAEMTKPRSGYDERVEIAIAFHDGTLLAATPAQAALRVDPEIASAREWLLVSAVVGALVDLAGPGLPAGLGDFLLRAGELPGGFLVLAYPAAEFDPEFVALAFDDDHAQNLDRLRARALALPPGVIDDVELRVPIDPWHPLRIAEAVARLGGRPADAQSRDAHEEAVTALLGSGGATVRPHEDPDPGLRAARRILQRLDGMGKWGGYHTEFAHLARGFAGNDRALAQEVGEALLEAGLLAEKPSVGQRHVFLNPGRAREIRRMIETGEVPPGMRLPSR
jgi:hypothetical protein